jgi:GNAT superfamily N-acetyltransferase
MSSKDLTIRMYQPRDIPRLIDMFMGAIPKLPNYSMIVPDPKRIEYVLKHNVDNAASFAGWVSCDSHDVPQGAVAGWCVANLMSNDLVADDIIMWIEPEFRTLRTANMMVNVYVEWAQARGAKLIRASHTGGSWPAGSKECVMFDTLLRRHGFKEVGNVYHWNGYEKETEHVSTQPSPR